MSMLDAGSQFCPGGVLGENGLYIVRKADDELYHRLRRGEYCNLLTCRQMGKSSLIERTRRRLAADGIRSVRLEMIETIVREPEQWYFGIARELSRGLGLDVDIAAWWQGQSPAGPVRKFALYLEHLLTWIDGPFVLFFDEIDSTQGLAFSDDFFTVIRSCYNARAGSPEYNRMIVVLSGVIRPTDLIKNRSRTPYNIGYQILLNDFTVQEGRFLLQGFQERAAPEELNSVYERIYYWTGGQPYLMQRLCAEVQARTTYTAAAVDEAAAELYGRPYKDASLQDVHKVIAEHPRSAELLELYQQIRNGRAEILDDDRDDVKSFLKITGLVKAGEYGRLVVRNPIYYEYFNDDWIRRTRPRVTPKRLTALALVLFVIVAGLIGYGIYQVSRSDEIAAATLWRSFDQAGSSDVRISNLSALIDMGELYQTDVTMRFATMPVAEQIRLFTELQSPEDIPAELVQVVVHVEHSISDSSEENDQVLSAMLAALTRIQPGYPDAGLPASEINLRLAARRSFRQKNYPQAIALYTQALDVYPDNPALYFERATVWIEQAGWLDALADYENIVERTPGWNVFIQSRIAHYPDLEAALRQSADRFPKLIGLMETP